MHVKENNTVDTFSFPRQPHSFGRNVKFSSKTTFIPKPLSSQNQFHPKTSFIQKPVLSKNQFHPKTSFIQKPVSSKNHFHPKTSFIPCVWGRGRRGWSVWGRSGWALNDGVVAKNNIVRVCVKASPAFGRRRLYTNTAYACLSLFNRPPWRASPAEGWRCST